MRKIKSKRWQCIRLCRYQAVPVSPGGTVVGVIAFREKAAWDRPRFNRGPQHATGSTFTVWTLSFWRVGRDLGTIAERC